MNFKKRIMFFVFIFPIAFIVGILISLLLSSSFEEQVQLDWIVVIVAALVLDLLITLRQTYDSKENKSAG